MAILSSMNIIGSAIGFLIPPLFVTSAADSAPEDVRSEFLTLLFFEFFFSLVPTVLILVFFKEKPPTLPR